MTTQAQASRIELIFVFIGLVVIGDAFREYVPSSIWQVIRLSYYGVLLIFVGMNLRTIVPAFIKTPFVTILTLLAVASVVWSANRPATISRTSALVMTTLFAAYFATRFSNVQQLKILAQTVIILAVFSVIFVFVFPEATSGAAWKGVFTQKNLFGRVMAMGALLALCYPFESRRMLLLKFFGYFVMLFFVFMSDSMTSLLIVVNVTLLSFALRVFRIGIVPGIALLIAMAIPAILFILFVTNIDTDAVLISLGKDPSLTGRTDVWAKVQYAISERMWTGYGHGAFFNRWDGIYGTLWSRNDAFTPGSAHNSYLDVWVNLGIAAPILFVISTAIMYLQALRKVRMTRKADGLWPVLYLSYLLILSTSEDFILFNSIYWTLYLVIAFSLTVQQKPAEARQSETILPSMPYLISPAAN